MVQDLGVDVIVTDHHEIGSTFTKHMQSYIQCIHRLIMQLTTIVWCRCCIQLAQH
ncbi:hypothetical protein ACVNP0_11820 [Staphylococcus aureus]